MNAHDKILKAIHRFSTTRGKRDYIEDLRNFFGRGVPDKSAFFEWFPDAEQADDAYLAVLGRMRFVELMIDNYRKSGDPTLAREIPRRWEQVEDEIRAVIRRQKKRQEVMADDDYELYEQIGKLKDGEFQKLIDTFYDELG